MARRDPRSARLLGLWTAGWLAVLLVAGLLWLGDLSLQWPVLLVPVLWALVALRPRRRGARGADDGYEGVGYHDVGYEDGYREDGYREDGYRDDDEDHWQPIPPPDRSAWPRPEPGHRTDTVERPAFDGRSLEEGHGDPRYREDRY